ncbi:hypothetical protein D3C75_648940 [compost metagenome]
MRSLATLSWRKNFPEGTLQTRKSRALRGFLVWWAHTDLNRGPKDYEAPVGLCANVRRKQEFWFKPLFYSDYTGFIRMVCVLACAEVGCHHS